MPNNHATHFICCILLLWQAPEQPVISWLQAAGTWRARAARSVRAAPCPTLLLPFITFCALCGLGLWAVLSYRDAYAQAHQGGWKLTVLQEGAHLHACTHAPSECLQVKRKHCLRA